jgi:hypothetical protein
MKDTKKRNKVAPDVSDSTTSPKKAKPEKPGVHDYPFMVDDLTEWAIVEALRNARRCEDSFDALYKRDAWWFIREMTNGVLKGESLASLQAYCAPDQFPTLYPAAVAAASAIRFMVDGMTTRREER